MESFITLRPSTANYTPSDLMLDYARDAKNPYVKAVRKGAWGQELRLILSGIEYKYDHCQIDPLLNGIDRVTVFLLQC